MPWHGIRRMLGMPWFGYQVNRISFVGYQGSRNYGMEVSEAQNRLGYDLDTHTAARDAQYRIGAVDSAHFDWTVLRVRLVASNCCPGVRLLNKSQHSRYLERNLCRSNVVVELVLFARPLNLYDAVRQPTPESWLFPANLIFSVGRGVHPAMAGLCRLASPKRPRACPRNDDCRHPNLHFRIPLASWTA